MGFVSAILNNAVSWAVNRNDPRASHWMFGNADATGETSVDDILLRSCFIKFYNTFLRLFLVVVVVVDIASGGVGRVD